MRGKAAFPPPLLFIFGLDGCGRRRGQEREREREGEGDGERGKEKGGCSDMEEGSVAILDQESLKRERD